MTRGSARSKLTAAEYLAWEREQTDKHEFHAGEVFAMAGGSPRHNWIAGTTDVLVNRITPDLFRAYPTILVEVLSSGRSSTTAASSGKVTSGSHP